MTDHQKTTDELESLVSSGKVKANLPTAMDSTHQSKLDKPTLQHHLQMAGEISANRTTQGHGSRYVRTRPAIVPGLVVSYTTSLTGCDALIVIVGRLRPSS